MAARITGYVTGIASGPTEDGLNVITRWIVTGSVVGATTGETVLTVDGSQNESQITAELRAALAAFVDPLISPPQGFAANNVRGCNI